jgi:hypothetical protein
MPVTCPSVQVKHSTSGYFPQAPWFDCNDRMPRAAEDRIYTLPASDLAKGNC